jgi:hypothetical protein
MSSSLIDPLSSDENEQIRLRCDWVGTNGGRQQLRGMLLAGAASEPTEPAAASYFEDLRRRVLYGQRESTAWTLR